MGCGGCNENKALTISNYDIPVDDDQLCEEQASETKHDDINEITLKYKITNYKKGDKI